MNLTSEILSQQPDNVLARLRRADQFWSALRSGKLDVAEVVSNSADDLGALDTELETDIVISGGTLGILLGVALQQRGWSVTLIERGVLRGRGMEYLS
jgi:lycopene cyclase CruP